MRVPTRVVAGVRDDLDLWLEAMREVDDFQGDVEMVLEP